MALQCAGGQWKSQAGHAACAATRRIRRQPSLRGWRAAARAITRRAIGRDLNIDRRKVSRDSGRGHKVAKNRLHLDIHASGGAGTTDRSVPLATRRQRVDAGARRLTELGATCTGALSADGLDHYAVGMKDPEGNEFDIN